MSTRLFAEGFAKDECGVLYVERRDLRCVLWICGGGCFDAAITKARRVAGFLAGGHCNLASSDACA